jgi:hypothetical protein
MKPRKVRGGFGKVLSRNIAMAFEWNQFEKRRKSIVGEPQKPAVAVRIHKNRKTKAGESERVCLLLSRSFVDAARLRKGDKLEACVDGSKLGLRLHPENGQAISGAEFTSRRQSSRSGKAKATPYVAFMVVTWKKLAAWAEARDGKWVTLQDKGTHWESTE